MRVSSRLSIAVAVVGGLTACQIPAPTKPVADTPAEVAKRSTPKVKATPTPTPQPVIDAREAARQDALDAAREQEKLANSAPVPTNKAFDCAGIAPMSSGTGFTLHSYATANGLAASGSGADLAIAPQLLKLKLQAYPGSKQVRIGSTQVTFKWKEGGADKSLAGPTLSVSPTTVTEASATAFGTPTDLTVPVPAGLLRAHFASAVPDVVTAVVSVFDDAGAPVKDHLGAALAVEVPYSTASAKTPAFDAKTSACGTFHGGKEVNVAVTGASQPSVVRVIEHQPPAVTYLKGKTTGPYTFKIACQAAPGTTSAGISRTKLSFVWKDASGAEKVVALPDFDRNVSLPAGQTADAPGARQDLDMSVDVAPLKEALEADWAKRPGVVTLKLELQFKKLDGTYVPVVNERLENVVVNYPVLVE